VSTVLLPRKAGDLVDLPGFKEAVLIVVTVVTVFVDSAVLTALAVFVIEYARTNSISYTFTKPEMKKYIDK
jgi:uncharacterized membrane protein